MKTRSLLIKMISDGENNFMQNNCNECTEQVQKFIIPNHKNGNEWQLYLITKMDHPQFIYMARIHDRDAN